ncbi:MAG: phospho-sugar mutase [Cyclobacteriaceae bacterium]|nr:phospho-sugar mutase [Cyclobacteriaceae bacterium]
MDLAVRTKAQEWLDSSIDESAKKEIRRMMDAEDQSELVDSFYKDLEFGTGGLRGLMGIGSNRVNKYTVGKATQGLSNYLLKAFPGEQVSVAIAHDSRNNSDFFAETTASVFSANGIKVYFFTELRPTPELSFAIRHLGCKSGVVLTASHNPKEYNGYKAYWDDGAQVTPPHDENVINEVSKISSIDEVKFVQNPALIVEIGEDIDKKYLAEVHKLSLSPEVIKRQKDLKIVFSPIHGTGITLVPEILRQFGFENVHVVKEQATPNGNFPTVVYPNPEEAEAMSLALAQARALDADLIMATDPDADRVGIGAKNNSGEFQLINGNQAASLLIYYMLKKWRENGKLDGKQFVIKTIVTTDLILDIALKFEVEAYETLTGFKYIAAVIKELEGKKQFIVGGEESYGYLVGDFVRDKDAISSCAMLAEMTAWAKENGMSLFDLLVEVYKEFGFYKESLHSITRKGKSGAEEIEAMMKNMRQNPPQTIHGSPVLKVYDYLSGEVKDVKSGKVSKLDFPKSNVLQYTTEDGTKISARPSGTEPKIKFYFSVKEALKSANDFDQVQESLNTKIENIIEELSLK